MEITIKVELSPSAELMSLISALMGSARVNHTNVAMTREESDAKIALPKQKSQAEEKEPEVIEESPKTKSSSKATTSWGLEDLKRVATVLQTETDFNVKEWLAKHNAISMSRLDKDEYDVLFAELQRIAVEKDVQTF